MVVSFGRFLLLQVSHITVQFLDSALIGSVELRHQRFILEVFQRAHQIFAEEISRAIGLLYRRLDLRTR